MKPSLKYLIVLNIVMNLPIAAAMSITASLMSGGINMMTLWLGLLGFLIACVINTVFPIRKIMAGFPKLFRVNPDSLGGALIGNIAVCFIFASIITMCMLLIVIGFQFPDVIFAFLGMFPLLYVVSYIVSFIVSPLAMKAAAAVAAEQNA